MNSKRVKSCHSFAKSTDINRMVVTDTGVTTIQNLIEEDQQALQESIDYENIDLKGRVSILRHKDFFRMPKFISGKELLINDPQSNRHSNFQDIYKNIQVKQNEPLMPISSRNSKAFSNLNVNITSPKSLFDRTDKTPT